MLFMNKSVFFFFFFFQVKSALKAARDHFKCHLSTIQVHFHCTHEKVIRQKQYMATKDETKHDQHENTPMYC